MRSCLFGLMLTACLAPLSALAEEPASIERRIIAYVKENLKPGQPVLISKLHNEVFTSPEERMVLDKLNRVFFRIPLFLVEHQATLGKLPNLEDIAGQFDLYGPEEAAVVLSVMESDPRVPKFIQRDPATGEVTAIDMEKIKADPRFNRLVERTLVGWEGKPVPELAGTTYEGADFKLSSLRGKVLLLYVWFTNCPPCVRITPELVTLHNKYGQQGFTVLGANADRALGLPYDDAARAAYAREQSISFPLIHLTPEARSALGNVNIFPTLFLIDREGSILKYYVNYQPPETLGKAVEQALASASGAAAR